MSRRRRRHGISRRRFLLGSATFAAGAQFAAEASAQTALDALSFGIDGLSSADQTAQFQRALEEARRQGRPLFLPAGDYHVGNLLIPADVTIQGGGRAALLAAAPGPVLRIEGVAGVVLDGLTIAPGVSGPGAGGGLVEIDASSRVMIRNCVLRDSGGSGLVMRRSAAAVEHCHFSGMRQAAIFSLDGDGLIATHNRIANCGDGGILVWGSENRRDGSILMGNFIQRIGALSGGNGQNGNGINVYKADEVIIADNQITGCAFTAIRLNSTNNCSIIGNLCMESGEVAIFSEFAFSGSVISQNIIDGAATGISITNLDDGGHLAACTGNIVRNIYPASLVNPDTRPVGIFVEAETSVTGNIVESVPGIGIMAGYGPFLRNVVIADNVINAVNIGIGVSVVQDPGPGAVSLSGNLISGALDYAIAGLEWEQVVSGDLVRDAGRYRHLSMGQNTIVP